MKLVIKEVTEVKCGQVWEYSHCDDELCQKHIVLTERISPDIYSEYQDYSYGFDRYNEKGLLLKSYNDEFVKDDDNYKLIGDITHDFDIIDGKLVKREIEHPAVGYVYESVETGELCIVIEVKSGFVWFVSEKGSIGKMNKTEFKDFFGRHIGLVGSPATFYLAFE